MDLDGLPMIGSGVDFTQVGAIHQKRTLAFINHFVTSTVSFLNNFSRSCEIRLQKCESRIQKLEASLDILEAKLTSIPGLSDVSTAEDPPTHSVAADISQLTSIPGLSDVSSAEDPPTHPVTVDMSQVPELMPEVVTSNTQTAIVSAPSPPTDTSSGMTAVKEHALYKRFFRMLHFGVPEPAVKMKMQSEGLDPSILSNPDLLVPACEAHDDSSSHPAAEDLAR